jgi:hypothetical protein
LYESVRHPFPLVGVHQHAADVRSTTAINREERL